MYLKWVGMIEKVKDAVKIEVIENMVWGMGEKQSDDDEASVHIPDVPLVLE